MARGKGGKAVVDRTKRGSAPVGGRGWRPDFGGYRFGSTGCSVQGWRAGLEVLAGVSGWSGSGFVFGFGGFVVSLILTPCLIQYCSFVTAVS